MGDRALEPAGSMLATSHLALVNGFTGDVQGGPAPSWGLVSTGRKAGRRRGLTFVTTLAGVDAPCLSGLAGVLVGRIGRPRLLIAVTCASVLAGTLLVLPA